MKWLEPEWHAALTKLRVVQAIYHVWSIDFMHDRQEDGLNLRLFIEAQGDALHF